METPKVVDVSVRRGWPALRSVSTPYLSRLWVPVYLRTYHITSGRFQTNIVSLGTLRLRTVNLVNLAAMKLDLRLATKPFGWKPTRRDRTGRLCGGSGLRFLRRGTFHAVIFITRGFGSVRTDNIHIYIS